MCHNEYHVLCTVLLSVCLVNAVMLTAVMSNVARPSVIMPIAVMLNVMLSVVQPFRRNQRIDIDENSVTFK